MVYIHFLFKTKEKFYSIHLKIDNNLPPYFSVIFLSCFLFLRKRDCGKNMKRAVQKIADSFIKIIKPNLSLKYINDRITKIFRFRFSKTLVLVKSRVYKYISRSSI